MDQFFGLSDQILSFLVSFVVSFLGSYLANLFFTSAKYKAKFAGPILVFCLTFMASYFSLTSYFNTQARLINVIQSNAVRTANCRTDYESIDTRLRLDGRLSSTDEALLLSTVDRAKRIEDILANIPDNRIDIEYQILKHHLLGFLNALIGESGTDLDSRREAITNARESCSSLNFFIEFINRKALSSERYQILDDWIHDDEVKLEKNTKAIEIWVDAIDLTLDDHISQQDSIVTLNAVTSFDHSYLCRFLYDNFSLNRILGVNFFINNCDE